MVLLVLYDIFITLGSLGTFALIWIWFKYKRSDLPKKVIKILFFGMIVVIVTYVLSFLLLDPEQFDGAHDMRPITGFVSNTFIGKIIFMYPMIIFMVAWFGYFAYGVLMSPYNISPNEKGYSAVSMAEQTKDEAERFGEGDNFK